MPTTNKICNNARKQMIGRMKEHLRIILQIYSPYSLKITTERSRMPEKLLNVYYLPRIQRLTNQKSLLISDSLTNKSYRVSSSSVEYANSQRQVVTTTLF